MVLPNISFTAMLHEVTFFFGSNIQYKPLIVIEPTDVPGYVVLTPCWCPLALSAWCVDSSVNLNTLWFLQVGSVRDSQSSSCGDPEVKNILKVSTLDFFKSWHSVNCVRRVGTRSRKQYRINCVNLMMKILERNENGAIQTCRDKLHNTVASTWHQFCFRAQRETLRTSFINWVGCLLLMSTFFFDSVVDSMRTKNWMCCESFASELSDSCRSS